MSYHLLSYSKGGRICLTKIFLYDTRILLSYRHLKNSICGERLSLNSPYQSKDRSSKRNSIVLNLLPRSFIIQGILTSVTEGDYKSTPHPDGTVTNYLTPHSFF